VDAFFRKNAVIGLAEILCRLPLIFAVGYLARSVGTENFGNWALIVVFQVFVVGVAGLGLSSSISRYAPASAAGEAGGFLRYAFGLCLVSILVLGTLAYLSSETIGKFLGLKANFYWLVPMAVLMAAGSVADGLLDAFFKARMTVGRQVGFIFARTLVELVAVMLVFASTSPSADEAPQRLAAYVGVVVVGKLLIYPGLLAGMMRGGRLPPPDRRREFLKYGLPMMPTFLAVWLAGQSDRLVLGHFATKSDFGVYAFGASLAAYMVFLGYAVYPLLLPGASRLHDGGDTAGVQTLFQDAQKLFVLLWAGGMACLALWSAEVIAWTGGKAFAGAAQVLLVLSFAVGLEQLMGIYQYVFHLVKRTDLILWFNLGYAALMIVTLAIVGATAGIAWAPWAVLVATLIFNVVRYRVALRYLVLPVPNTLFVQVAALAVLTALLANYAADCNVPLRVAATAVLGFAFAGLALRRMAVSIPSALS